MIDGIILGAATFLSLYLSWQHLPTKIKKLTFKIPLVSDLIAGIFSYLLLSSVSKSLAAVVGAIFTGLLVNFALIIGRSKYE